MELIFGSNGVELVKDTGNWQLKSEIGFSPVQTMAASVGACGMYVFRAILEKSSVAHEIIKAEVTYELDESIRSKPISKIKVVYHMKIADALKDKAERFMDLVPRSCPVMQSLNPNIEVVESILYI